MFINLVLKYKLFQDEAQINPRQERRRKFLTFFFFAILCLTRARDLIQPVIIKLVIMHYLYLKQMEGTFNILYFNLH